MQQRKVKRTQHSTPITLPAPVGGLNGRDGLADMPPTDAFVLDNLIPNNTTVDSRGGSEDYATGIAAAVETLEVYRGGSSSKMLGFAGGKIYDVSSAGAVGAALVSGRVSNVVSTTMFSNAGSQFLLGVSGADQPFAYDGTTVTLTNITGLTGSQNDLHGIFSFKGRVYLAQKNQLGFYYLAVGAIQGAASYFDLSQQCKSGGYLVGIASFSRDAGNGLNDYIVFMTSEGEYLVYAGTDPSSAATFALAGRYYSSAPIGRKGWFNFRSDLYIISDEGVVAFSQIMSNGEAGVDFEYLSSKLGRYISDLNRYSNVHGWCANVYPRSNLLIVNVPATSGINGTYYQFAMNTDTNRWCRFTDWNGISWCVFNKRLYFGTFTGEVVLADEGLNDNDEPIKADARQAYNYFDDGRGMGSADKQFHFGVFFVQSNGTPPISAELCVNFEDSAPLYAGSLDGGTGAVWDVASWDLAEWAGEGATQNFTVGFGKLGIAASIWMRAYLDGTSLRWYATRVVCQRANGIVLV
jgi:hypothetical protein